MVRAAAVVVAEFPIDRFAAGESLIDAVPVRDGRFSEPPAEAGNTGNLAFGFRGREARRHGGGG